jgi:ribosomal protein S27AE
MKCPNCKEKVIFEEHKPHGLLQCPKCHAKNTEQKIKDWNAKE